MFGKSTRGDDYQDLARPVGAMAKDFVSGFHLLPHSHERAQLLHAVKGVMAVKTPDGAWAVPPRGAVWIPPGTVHEIRMWGEVAMRTLYLDGKTVADMPSRCRVVSISALLRELILQAVELPMLYDESGRAGRIMGLILDEIRTLPILPLDLPLPRDPRLLRICETLQREPALDRTLDGWGEEVGASARTLARLFQSETGFTFGRWRQQARLLEALGRLALGQPVTTVALDLGYDSPSAFTSMFRRALGITPSRYVANA